MKLRLLVTSVLVIFYVFAGTPQQFSFQGYYMEDGRPFSGEMQNVKFTVEQGNGVDLWAKKVASLTFVNGVFSYVLGSEPIDDSGKSFAAINWGMDGLFVKVDLEDGTQISRVKLLSVPYALQAGNAEKLGGQILYEVMPVGTILAWHKTLVSSKYPLPDGWMECNGQTITDTESLLVGSSVPSLNSSGRFLRGGNGSGVYQEDTLKSHTHGAGTYYAVTAGGVRTTSSSGAHAHSSYGYKYSPGGSSRPRRDSTDGSKSSSVSTSTSGNHNHTVDINHSHDIEGNSSPRGDAETRPKNMSVIWIIKIK